MMPSMATGITVMAAAYIQVKMWEYSSKEGDGIGGRETLLVLDIRFPYIGRRGGGVMRTDCFVTTDSASEVVGCASDLHQSG